MLFHLFSNWYVSLPQNMKKKSFFFLLLFAYFLSTNLIRYLLYFSVTILFYCRKCFVTNFYGAAAAANYLGTFSYLKWSFSCFTIRYNGEKEDHQISFVSLTILFVGFQLGTNLIFYLNIIYNYRYLEQCRFNSDN